MGCEGTGREGKEDKEREGKVVFWHLRTVSNVETSSEQKAQVIII